MVSAPSCCPESYNLILILSNSAWYRVRTRGESLVAINILICRVLITGIRKHTHRKMIEIREIKDEMESWMFSGFSAYCPLPSHCGDRRIKFFFLKGSESKPYPTRGPEIDFIQKFSLVSRISQGLTEEPASFLVGWPGLGEVERRMAGFAAQVAGAEIWRRERTGRGGGRGEGGQMDQRLRAV